MLDFPFLFTQQKKPQTKDPIHNSHVIAIACINFTKLHKFKIKCS